MPRPGLRLGPGLAEYGQLRSGHLLSVQLPSGHLPSGKMKKWTLAQWQFFFMNLLNMTVLNKYDAKTLLIRTRRLATSFVLFPTTLDLYEHLYKQV